jgi:hypothetical protein
MTLLSRIHVRAVLVASVACGLAGCTSCSHTPEPEAHPQASAEPAVSSSGPSALDKWRARHPRDDAGNLIPKSTPPPIDPNEIPPKPGREPDWDLDSEDAAHDYVRRYVVATNRYGSLACVNIGASTSLADRANTRSVEVRTSARCADAGSLPGTQRDVFLVDVAGDRLTVDDKSKRDPLARWPDGSDPEGPPGPVQNASNMHKWHGPLKDAVFNKQQLVVIRVQLYGRGSYPVITVAGWHGAVMPTATPEDLRAFDEELCQANDGMPLGIFASIDRSRMLRIRCPGPPSWDRL